jgi:hypothetical protein
MAIPNSKKMMMTSTLKFLDVSRDEANTKEVLRLPIKKVKP